MRLPPLGLIVLFAGMVAFAPLAAAATELPSIDSPSDQLADPVGQLVFFAVLEGLYRDGVGNQAVDLILPKNEETGGVKLEDHFVYACPLCMPAIEAFRLYRSRQRLLGDKKGRDTFGKGLDAGMLERLGSARREDQFSAIQELITRWVQQRLALMRLSADEQIAWNAAIDARRKAGQRMLKSFKDGEHGDSYIDTYRAWSDACSICDGARDACNLRGEMPAPVTPRR